MTGIELFSSSPLNKMYIMLEYVLKWYINLVFNYLVNVNLSRSNILPFSSSLPLPLPFFLFLPSHFSPLFNEL